MAQGGRNKPVQSGASSGPRPPAPKGKSGSAPKGKPGTKGRQSVASARKSSGSNRTQLIIGIVAVVIIAVVVAIGVVMNKKNTAVQGAGYGASTKSIATVDSGGIITVSNGTPKLTLDIYEDAICPACAEFEHQYGQQVAQSIDASQVAVRYHMVAFLDPSSASKNYSTRAFAALITVASEAGSTPGLFLNFHSALYDPANQPKENGTSDLSNAQLGDLALKVGAPASVQKQIADGTDMAKATAAAATNYTSLSTVTGGQPGTPTVAKDGVPVSVNATDWLTTLIAAA